MDYILLGLSIISIAGSLVMISIKRSTEDCKEVTEYKSMLQDYIGVIEVSEDNTFQFRFEFIDKVDNGVVYLKSRMDHLQLCRKAVWSDVYNNFFYEDQVKLAESLRTEL